MSLPRQVPLFTSIISDSPALISN